MLVENEKLELKKSLAQLKEGIISLCSMLNKGGEGEVIFGISDEGKFFGVDISKKSIQDIVHEIQNNLKPLPINVNVVPFTEEDKTLIKMTAIGDDTPYSAYGRYYIRMNDSDILMSSNQLQHFFEEKKDNYLIWENQETKYGVDDIDEELLIDCIRTANDKGRLDYVYRNAKEALKKLGLITENDKLNNAGYYLFSNKKPLTIKEASFPTDSRSEFGEIKEFRGNIFECINESVSYITNHMSFKADIVGLQRIETPEIPIKAIREIVINSFAHCQYEKVGDFNTYSIYKSSIRIYNPGPIIKNVDPINFASGKVGSKIRNPLIASTLYKYGYIDAFGTGFDRTFSLCNQENINYKYNNDEFGFTFTFLRNVDFLFDNSNINNNHTIFRKEYPIDIKILRLVKQDRFINVENMSKALNVSAPTIQRHIKALEERGNLHRVGSRKTGYWEIT